MPTIEIFLLSVFRFIVSIFDLWLVWVENICNNIKKSNFTKPLSKKIVIREPLFKSLRLHIGSAVAAGVLISFLQ